MSDSLGVRRHFVVFVVREVDVARLQRREQFLDESDLLRIGSMLDDDESLAVGGHGRTVERVDRDNLDIRRQVLLERFPFGRFDRSLSRNNRSEFRR